MLVEGLKMFHNCTASIMMVLGMYSVTAALPANREGQLLGFVMREVKLEFSKTATSREPTEGCL